jgi:phosphorylcholine metabolism protein LicD
MPYILQNTHYWMDFGTLLGMEREGKIIDHDDDVDFSVLNGTFDLEEIKKRCEECGFWLDDSDDKSLLRVRYSNTNYLHSDIWVWQDEQGILTHRFWAKLQSFPKKLITPTQTKKYWGMQFEVPNDIETFLKIRYGEDWMKPHKTSDGWHPEQGKLSNPEEQIKKIREEYNIK